MSRLRQILWPSTPFLFAVAMIVTDAADASAQGNPTGTISGHVIDPDGLPVPGATVTVASPALQGVRAVTTSTNGDYIVPLLPAGDYEVTFELQGFKSVIPTNVPVRLAETQPLDVTLTLAAVAETVTVVGQSPEIVPTATKPNLHQR
jgi:Carboxypeptidase regulatory-like domain